MRCQVREEEPSLAPRKRFLYSTTLDSRGEPPAKLDPRRGAGHQGFAKVMEIRVRHNFVVSNERRKTCER